MNRPTTTAIEKNCQATWVKRASMSSTKVLVEIAQCQGSNAIA